MLNPIKTIFTAMKRQDYRKPAMRVVELRQRCCILAGSGEPKSAQKQDYESEEWY